MGVKKSTKKFEKNKLGKVLDQRKASAKSKQLHALNEKRKKKRRVENARDESDKEGEQKMKGKKAGGDQVGIKAFEGMSVDDFLDGGFEVPEVKGKGKGKGKKEENGVGRKRKRTPDDEGEDEESGVEVNAASVDDAEESDDDDVTGELEKHKADIAALVEADPEFYKYLQENDSELLNFNDFPDIDELSEGESSEEEGAKKKPKKKTKKKSGDSDEEAEEDEDEKKSKTEEVTKALVKKWKRALAEENSLRALRKVVLAFRAAVNVDDQRRDNSHQFKYSITNPDGIHNSLSEVFYRHLANAICQCTMTSCSSAYNRFPSFSTTTSPSKNPPPDASACPPTPRSSACLHHSLNRTHPRSSLSFQPSPIQQHSNSSSHLAHPSYHTYFPSANN